jgi:hypothetical protein
MGYGVCQIIGHTYTMTPALTALELKTATGGCGVDIRIVIQTDALDKHEAWKTGRWMVKQSEK